MNTFEVQSLKREYQSRQVELITRWEQHQLPRSHDEAFTLITKCVLSSRTNWDKVVQIVDNLAKSGLLFSGTASELYPYIRKIGGQVDHEKRASWVIDNREMFIFVFAIIESIYNRSIVISPSGLGPKEMLSVTTGEEFYKIAVTQGITQEGLRTLVKGLKGVGDKQASHFLFSLGFEGFAVIDTYILDELVGFKIIPPKPGSLTSSRYHKIEQSMKQFSEEQGIPLHFLDMLWWRNGKS